MDKKDIAIFVAIFFALSVRLYLRYVKKDKNKTGSSNPNIFASSLKDEDDYEPYSGNKN